MITIMDKAKFVDGFKMAAKDPEMLIMAEEEMDDYLDQLDSLIAPKYFQPGDNFGD